MQLIRKNSPLSAKPLPQEEADAGRAPHAWAFAGAVLGLFISLILFAPASWLAHVVEQASKGQIQLQQTRGTLWNGSAQLVLTGGADSRDITTLPTRLNWTLRPGWRGAQLALHSECCTAAPIRARLSAGFNSASIHINDSQIDLPATLLAGLGTPWNTVALQGQLRMSTTGLNLQYQAGRTVNHGHTRLEALAVSSRLSPLKPLGSYRLDIEGGDSSRLTLSTLQGDLQLTGQGQWIGSRLHFNGEASASPEREAALSNLLNILGQRQGARSIINIG